MGVPLADLVAAAKAQLATIGNCSHYEAMIPETPPTVSDEDLRVLAYTVLWPTPGAPGDEQAQAGGAQVDVEWRFMITCAAGLTDLAYDLIDLVTDRFEGWEPVLNGLSVGTCSQDFDPGPLVPGTGFMPVRYYLQLPYVLQVGA